MRIQNGILITIENGRFENGYVDFENGVITAFGDLAQAAPYEGEVYDAQGGWIMPGFMDAHTHIGISEEGMRWEGRWLHSRPCLFLLFIVDKVDRARYRSRSF